MATTNTLQSKWPNGLDTIKAIATRSPRVLLSFSRGKDALACWLAMRPHFEEIIPYYFHVIPEPLSFETESLDYYEKFFGVKITRLYNPAQYRMFNDLVFQPPERCAIIEAARFPLPDKDEFIGWLRDDLKLPADTFNAIGLRLSDSLARRAMFAKGGPVNEKRKVFYPAWDMNKAELIDIISRNGCKLPADYRIMGSTFDSMTYRYLKPISVHFPDDYAKILKWYPLADLSIFRREVVQNG